MAVEEDTESWFSGFIQQLSGIMVIIIVAGGILICILLFIFAKRQIERFAIRSHRGTTIPGAEASKSMKREINRRMDAIREITYEPKLLQEGFESKDGLNDLPCHYYRMKTMDANKTLEDSVLRKKLGKRQNFESLRSYLISALTNGMDARVIHQYCDLYEGARFNPKPFTEKEFKQFQLLLEQLKTSIVQLETKRSIRGASSSRESSKSKNIGDASHLTRRAKWTEKVSVTDSKEGVTVPLTDSTQHHIGLIGDTKSFQESTQV